MTKSIDNFLAQYHAEKDQVKRLNVVSDFVNMYYDSNFSDINPILEKELAYCEREDNVDGEALLRYMLSYSYFETGQFSKGEEGFRHVMQILPRVTDHSVRSQVLNFQAFMESHQGNYDKALEYAFECVRESELSPEGKNTYWGIYTLGVLYYDLKDYSKAEEYFTLAEQKFRIKGNGYGVARSETGLSSVYIQQGKNELAEKLLNSALVFYDTEEVKSGTSRSLNDLGVLYRNSGRLEEALGHFLKALTIRKETNHTQGIATTLNEIGEVLILMDRFDEASRYLEEARELCESIRNRTKLYRTHWLFSRLYRKMNEPWKALEHYELYDKIRTEVTGEVASNKINALQKKVATEKAEKEKEIQRVRYEMAEQKNKETRDSIEYARRIQQALLAHEDMLKKHLKEYFVLYLPKDIVSGDFYWATEKDGRFYLAVCDSTGHGVPGAFMSLLNISYMNEAITEKGMVSPDLVFNHVRKRLIGEISADGAQDGMDGILLSVEGKFWKYAAANNSPLIVSGGTAQELDSDKMPVGKGVSEAPFRGFHLDPKGMLYLFTDGFGDQFGGSRGKKYKHKNLVSFLQKISGLPPGDQKHALEKEFQQWKGNQEQVDDVLIVGIRM